MWHWPAGPAPELSPKTIGHCVSPLWGTCEKIYGDHRRKNIWWHLACLLRKKWWHWPASPSEKNYSVALAAGWDSDMSPYNYFFGEKYRSIIFFQDPDALVSGLQNLVHSWDANLQIEFVCPYGVNNQPENPRMVGTVQINTRRLEAPQNQRRQNSASA